MRIAARFALTLLLAACSSNPPPKDDPLDADPPEGGATEEKRSPALQKGEELIEAGKFAEAMPHLKSALDADPKNAAAAAYLALAIEQTGGDKKEAEKLYKQALALDSRLVGAANNLAALYLEDPPRPDEAIGVLQKGLAVEPENVELLTNLGFAYGLKGKVDESSKAFEKAIAKEPTPRLHLAFGSMLFENKRAEQAVPPLLKAAEGMQDDAASLATIARMLGPGKAFDDCVRLLDRAITLKPDVAELLVRRGICKHELKKEKEAGQDFEAATKLDPKFQAAHYYLGVSLLEQGKKQAGQKALKAAYELGKDTPIGKQAKDRLDGKKKGDAPKKAPDKTDAKDPKKDPKK